MVDYRHFRLCSGGHDSFDDYALRIAGAIVGRGRVDGDQSWFIEEEVVSGSSTMGFGLDEVGDVRVYVEAHGTGVITDDDLWMGGSII